MIVPTAIIRNVYIVSIVLLPVEIKRIDHSLGSIIDQLDLLHTVIKLLLFYLLDQLLMDYYIQVDLGFFLEVVGLFHDVL